MYKHGWQGVRWTSLEKVRYATKCDLSKICADRRTVGFDIQCGALDDSLNPVMEAYKNML